MGDQFIRDKQQDLDQTEQMRKRENMQINGTKLGAIHPNPKPVSFMINIYLTIFTILAPHIPPTAGYTMLDIAPENN